MLPQHETEPLPPRRRVEGPRRILIVEDDDAVGRMLHRMLKSHGEVTVVCDPREALGLLAAEAFDVVTCDLMMPGMSGFELLAHVRERCPGARRVLVTGSTDIEPKSPLFDASLMKPFSRAALLRAVLGEGVAT